MATWRNLRRPTWPTWRGLYMSYRWKRTGLRPDVRNRRRGPEADDATPKIRFLTLTRCWTAGRMFLTATGASVEGAGRSLDGAGAVPPRSMNFGLKHAPDVLVVGAGFAGSIVAERLASRCGLRVLVVDRRPHVAGNA